MDIIFRLVYLIDNKITHSYEVIIIGLEKNEREVVESLIHTLCLSLFFSLKYLVEEVRC